MNARIVEGLRSKDPYIARAAQSLAGKLIEQQFKNPEYGKLNDEQIFDKHTGKVLPAGPGYKPLVDPQERARFGIEPTDTRPYQVGPGNKLINPPPENRVNIDQRGPDSFETGYGTSQVKRADAIIEAGDKASSVYQRNQLLRALNNSIKTGKITPAQATIGAWAKSVGIDPSVLGIDASLPTNAETFNAISNESMMSKLGPGGFPSQNFSDTDRKFLEKTVTNLGDQPLANEFKLAVSDRISELQMEKADRWQDISTSVPRAQRAEAYDRFERDWRKEMKTRNVFGDIIRQINPPTPQNSPANPANTPAQPSINDIDAELKRRGLR